MFLMRLSTIAWSKARKCGLVWLFLLTSSAWAESEPANPNFVFDGTTIRCALVSGPNAFVFRTRDLTQQRRVRLVNANGVAQGEIFIAVSDRPLTENESGWKAVEGAIRFRNKRQFTLSLVGVQAEYVKLTLRVEDSQEDMVEELAQGIGAFNAETLLSNILALQPTPAAAGLLRP